MDEEIEINESVEVVNELDQLDMVQQRNLALIDRQTELKRRISSRLKVNRIAITVGIACLLAPIVISFLPLPYIVAPRTAFMMFIVSLMYGLSLLMFPFLRPENEFTVELQEIENELDLLSIQHSSIEERAEKLFKHHHFELKRYYDENLKQSSWLFVVGISCIVMGFVIIGITLYLLVTNIDKELENKIIIASMGAVSAILTNFIAVFFLKMHSETIKSSTEFHNRFVNTHHFHFGNFLISKIKDDAKREDALAELAISINQNVFPENGEIQHEPLDQQNQPNQQRRFTPLR